MIKSLKRLDSSEQERILSSLAAHFLPTPYEREEPLSQTEQVALDEIWTKLRMSKYDKSPAARRMVLELISELISEPVRSSARWNDARARLGNRGLLRPNQYQLVTGPFDKVVRFAAIRESHIESIIYNADQYEDILEDRLRDTPVSAIRLCKKRINDFYVVVQTKKVGYKLTAEAAYRLYPDFIDVNDLSTPMNSLKAFIDRYGVYFELNDHPSTNLVLYDVINGILSTKDVQNRIKRTGVDPIMRSTAINISIYTLPHLHVTQIYLLYAIDYIKYGRDLISKGVNISLDEFGKF